MDWIEPLTINFYDLVTQNSVTIEILCNSIAPATLNIYKIDACVIIGTTSACATRASRRITSTAYSCISPSDLSEENMQPCMEGGKWRLLA